MDFDSIWMAQKWAVLDSIFAIINFHKTPINTGFLILICNDNQYLKLLKYIA